jgi:sarcosine oxidase subunit alpha
MASGERLLARSFKYHRPRGLYTAGPEEPNVLVTVGEGTRRTPNCPAPQTELYDGLVASSQNRWPSLRHDIGAVNALLSPFFAAGFYYKTFMWPPAFWEKVYEPLIRRAAGLGPAPSAADPDSYEHRHAHCDVLVVGSGAAGLAAARAAGEAGARVILADHDFELGGGLLAEPKAWLWRDQMVTALAAMPEVRILTRTNVFGFSDGNVLGALERVGDHLPDGSRRGVRQRYWVIRAREVVLATGSYERMIAFPDNDRPGVMLASAAETYARRFAAVPGRRAVLFATNDQAYATAKSLTEAGADIIGIVDPRTSAPALDDARRRGIPVHAGSVISGVSGAKGLEAVRVRHVGGGPERSLAADCLCVSGGHNPAVQLASMTRAKLIWDDEIAAFVPGPAVQAERSAGSARGVFGIGAAAEDGRNAGSAAATRAGFTAKPAFALPVTAAIARRVHPLWEVEGKGKAFVDLQHDATADDMRLAHREGYTHVEHAKRYTTHGMATDQGKTGGLVGIAVLAAARGEPIETVGVPTYRPYVHGVTWGAIAGRETGPNFKHIRRTPLHAWHEQNGAVFMETGLWLRPGYYSKTRETGWAPILKEARAVRQAVGICDVSTLGKIDVQGPDAATFLDRLYTNTFSTLPVGRARYGLMLREDGHVFDDGTTSRLGPQRFLLTTTTAKAADVLEHMEKYHQTVWPDLDVQFCSVTDQWAQMSVAGPQARATLDACLQGLDLKNDAFPFMAVGEGRIGGSPVRVFRVSFSGELAFEVATPARHGIAVWQAILAAGTPHGIVPYGLEALSLLRVEKGHVAGAELNGQTTARDLGFEKMLKKQGDYIGRTMAERPGMIEPARPRLVGIRATTTDFAHRLRGGAHIVASRGSRESLGWVTSVTRSVELDRWIGLAMVRGGAERLGQTLVASYPLKGEEIEVEITSPHHVDPENARVKT